MRIALPKPRNSYHCLTNVGLEVGDEVWPLTHGWNDGQTYYVMGFRSASFAGFPEDPHIILDLNYGSKSYEVRTDKGYGPRESYFKPEQL